jgi:hypothetical protein
MALSEKFGTSNWLRNDDWVHNTIGNSTPHSTWLYLSATTGKVVSSTCQCSCK